MNNFVVRPAVFDDIEEILSMIKELADYENASEQVVATQENLAAAFFSDKPAAYALICETAEKEIAGFIVYFYSFSTWLGKKGIYLDDFYVRPKFRKKGAGLLLFKHLANIAKMEKCDRLEWHVLNWNKPAIDFYNALSAKPQDEWILYRMETSAIVKFADK